MRNRELVVFYFFLLSKDVLVFASLIILSFFLGDSNYIRKNLLKLLFVSCYTESGDNDVEVCFSSVLLR